MSPDHDSAEDPALDPVVWGSDGQPRSRAFGDVYFSAADGLAETRAVFLQGCGLPEAWRGRRRFVVGELGFGTGLNIAALLDLWRRTAPAGARLHVFTLEAHPLKAADAARALGAWPELAEVSGALLAGWPGWARGWRRIDLPEFRATIDLAMLDAAEALQAWTGRADAWFLDGFAPAVNPAMWTPQILELVAARSAPGAAAATFTVAGAVRRGLAAAGFDVEKKPGFGRKRERLQARLPGPPRPDPAARRVAVVGGGIAGAAAARAVRALGGEAIMFEAEAPGAGASGNPAVLVAPRLDAGLGAAAQLFAQAFTRAVQLYATVPDAVIARGVRQLPGKAADLGRFRKAAGSGLFDPGALRLTEDGLDQATALVVDPAPLLTAWAGEFHLAHVAGLRAEDGGWTLLDAAGAILARADAVILAAGLGCESLADGLDLACVRGQASWAAGEIAPAVSWGGYAAPTRDGLLFGATHDRGDRGTDVRPADHARNLAALAEALPQLAARLSGATLAGRAGLRVVTRDNLPIAGPAPQTPAEGLFVLTGFGGRGFVHAPLLAEHVAALALGAPSPLPAAAQALVDPARFARRAARRRHS
ncbi:tRNA (5-methylaminomethyl-2-thiouridine)(34)-methyltransferase MnmD [Phenylobacterium sp.]|jgi:tRNA 5-methylaminomethyl-2-thiouridine biosynthesis bifunctional protein|uniref:tRNA (5-methylaminomethyl-2-thiouridine)(34)-methyltransferase MnmD n=1 Tax=Phenylobacterium sp. TaxID=1871053 RepID=UPI002F4206CC